MTKSRGKRRGCGCWLLIGIGVLAIAAALAPKSGPATGTAPGATAEPPRRQATVALEISTATPPPTTPTAIAPAAPAPAVSPAADLPAAAPAAGGYVCADGARCIKGNVNDGKKLYHFPGCPSYAQTQIDEGRGERYFATAAEAEAAGWRRASNCP